MANKTILAVLALGISLLAASPTIAACTVPNTITNGQVADASKVMGNFTALANCAQQGNLTGDVTTSGGAVASLSNTGVTPGTYSVPTIAVDAKGRITSAANGSAGGGGSTVAPTVIQSKLIVANQPAADGVAFDAPVGPGHIILALAVHWHNNPVVGAGWIQLLNTNGAVGSGLFASMKVATSADVGAFFMPFSGGDNGQALALFELANASPAPSAAVMTVQEVTTSSLTINGASAQNNSLIVGIAASDVSTAAPTAISGGMTFAEAQGATINSSPTELTAFKIDSAATGAKNVTLTYGSSARHYGILVAISPQ